MRKIVYYIITLFIVALVSCKTKQPHQVTIYDAEQEEKETSTENKTKIKEIHTYDNLTDLIRNVSGVKVTGSGANTTIVIRGKESFGLSNEPLFVIDGVMYNRSYSSLYGFIVINQVKSITVLKDVASTGFYGANGANGVIEITLK